MAVVGSLLNDNDIGNIDTLMRHEKDTEFHSTNPEAVPVKIGEYGSMTKINIIGVTTSPKRNTI